MSRSFSAWWIPLKYSLASSIHSFLSFSVVERRITENLLLHVLYKSLLLCVHPSYEMDCATSGHDVFENYVIFQMKPNWGRFCLQVSTGTGIVSYLVHLLIAVPEAFILGNGEYHVEQGSTINLVCIIEKVILVKVSSIICISAHLLNLVFSIA